MATRSGEIAQPVIATAAGIGLLYFLRAILVPLVLAIVLAVLVNSLVRVIAKLARGAPHWAVVSFAGLIVMLCANGAILIVGQGIVRMVKQMPMLLARIEQIFQQLGQAIGLASTPHITTMLNSIDVPEVAGNVAGGVSSTLGTILLMITYFIFILAGRRYAKQKLAHLANSPAAAKTLEAAIGHIAGDIETYLWVQTVTGVMIAGASAIVMYAVGLDNALFWTIVLFLLCYIPMIGVTVGSVVPALFALLQFPSWWQAALVFGGIQFAAFVVGNFIYPRMQAESQNIDPVATLFSLAFWGFLWGITGAFLAVPLTLMVMMICANFPRTRWLAVLLSNDGNPQFPKTHAPAK